MSIVEDNCPTCGVSRKEFPGNFFDDHETCADCEHRQQGLDMDLAERDRQEDQPFVGPTTDGTTGLMATQLGRLKILVKNFEAVQNKHCKFGATDTEPDGEFQVQIARALKHEPWKNLTINQWELYSMPGAGIAAREMNMATKKVVEYIKATMPIDIERVIGPYLKDYCWRVAINL